MKQNISDLARYRWPGILMRLGIHENYLTGRHGPCPLCPDGGKDRYMFTNKDDDGMYYCHQCGAGDGFHLLMRFHNWDFKQTAREVEKIVGDVKQSEPRQKTDPMVRLRNIQVACRNLTDDCSVTRYLRNRGLSRYPESIQTARLPYYKQGEKVGEFDTMVAKVVSVDNKPLTYHLTYTEDGAKADVTPTRKVMSPVSPIAGGAVRLFRLDCHTDRNKNAHLAIAEGIETALAVHELTDAPCWSVLSAVGMESFQVPAGVAKLTIYADNDNNFTGQKAAYTLANRLALDGNVDVNVCVPVLAGRDWLDVLMEEAG